MFSLAINNVYADGESFAAYQQFEAEKGKQPHQVAEALFQAWSVDPDTVFIDVETTGFKTPEILELGIIDYQGNTIYHQRFLPKSLITHQASEVHHIKRKELKGLPTWQDEATNIYRLLKGRSVVAYKSAFEKRAFAKTNEIHDTAMPELNFQCAMRAYSYYRKELPQSPYKHFKLGKALEEYGVSLGERLHSAVGDAEGVYLLVQRVNQSLDKE